MAGGRPDQYGGGIVPGGCLPRKTKSSVRKIIIAPTIIRMRPTASISTLAGSQLSEESRRRR
jgi:hypothetical protein